MNRAATLRHYFKQQQSLSFKHLGRNDHTRHLSIIPRPCNRGEPSSATPVVHANDVRVFGARCFNFGGALVDIPSLSLNGLRSFSSIVDGEGDFDKAKSLSDLDKEIISLSKSGSITAAEELLNQTQTNALNQNNKTLLPNIESYTSYLTALTQEQSKLISNKSDQDESPTQLIVALAEKAHHALVSMEDISGVSDEYSSMRLSGNIKEYELRDASLRPMTVHYNLILLGFANAAVASKETGYTNNFTLNGPYVAQRWLQRMETLGTVPNSGVTPSVESYRYVMRTCSVIGTVNRQNKSTILTQAIFDKLKQNTKLKPTVEEYRLLMNTWGCSLDKDSAYRATGVWKTMIKAFLMGDKEKEPTLEDGKMVLEAWSRSSNKHAARRANNVLMEMEKLFTQKKTQVKPDLDCYRFLLKAMTSSRVPEGTNIPKLFKTMEENQLFPDTECYDLALAALNNSTRCSTDEEAKEYSKQAQQMLIQMEKESERSSVSEVKPSATSYTNVIQALAARHKKDVAEKAAWLLKKMEVEFAAGDESMRPTRDSYVGVINAFGTCGSAKNFILANEVLQRMIHQHAEGNEAARPDVCSYHAVIKACARASDTEFSTPEREREALLLALSTVQDMKQSEYVHPNAKSYLLLLQCCIRLLPEGDEREKLLCTVFRSCAKNGLVSQQMLQEFQSASSAEAYHREVVADAAYFDEMRIIPEKWTRNLGYRVRVKDALVGKSGKRSPIISVSGAVVSTTAYNDYRMRRRWAKKGKLLLQGGRV